MPPVRRRFFASVQTLSLRVEWAPSVSFRWPSVWPLPLANPDLFILHDRHYEIGPQAGDAHAEIIEDGVGHVGGSGIAPVGQGVNQDCPFRGHRGNLEVGELPRGAGQIFQGERVVERESGGLRPISEELLGLEGGDVRPLLVMPGNMASSGKGQSGGLSGLDLRFISPINRAFHPERLPGTQGIGKGGRVKRAFDRR